MKAREGGLCRICRKQYEPGEEINKYDNGKAHESCIGGMYDHGVWRYSYRRKGKSKKR